MSPVMMGINGSTLSHGFENPLALLVDLLLLPPFSLLYCPNPSPAATVLFNLNDDRAHNSHLLTCPACSHDFDDEIETAIQTHEKIKLNSDIALYYEAGERGRCNKI